MARRTHTRRRRVIPGFGLTGAVTLLAVSLVVLVPLASIAVTGAQMGPEKFLATITRPRTLSSFYVSFMTALVASAINALLGTVLAWVLVRYRFPGRAVLDGMVELPLALPTAVAGIALTSLTTDQGWVGSLFAAHGIHLAYTRAGITIALVFVGIPFVVRAVQPVLQKLDPAYEEAAEVMGASRATTFRRVILPELMPALLTGFGLALSRCLGEYGSVVFIAGNMPFQTEIAPLVIMSELQEFDYAGASAVALVMLAAAFLILFCMGLAQARNARILRGGE
ncbi:sulfate ABC transporter permease subunit CysT [uncultured Parolsenella sp.]|uniref:sulfate ABC transporter permease subunit CysT n=1 Tax=uncultured Parolsenella sp. TaxID=2083008 RepID=UPI0027D97C89|nr:sulfate ABC transporter permease subunit CysT [uncultured Parolsenella sp.]